MRRSDVVHPMARPDGRGHRCCRLCRRVVWAALLAVHIAGSLAAWRDLFHAPDGSEFGYPLFRAIFLSAASVFIGLKLADVSFLRFKPGWRPWVTSALIVALLHVGMLEHGLSIDLKTPPTKVGVVLFVSVVVDPRTLRNLLDRIVWRLRHLDRLLHFGYGTDVGSHSVFARRLDTVVRPFERLLILCLSPPRAPPVC